MVNGIQKEVHPDDASLPYNLGVVLVAGQVEFDDVVGIVEVDSTEEGLGIYYHTFREGVVHAASV